jgi:adenine/guanine phosphoribosyltransferase-like PRPP-binding protein
MAENITRELIRQGKKTWHVFSSAGSWVVKRGGTRRATRIFSSQAEAIDLARSLARGAGGEVVIHRKDGRMQEHEVVRNGDLETVYVYNADARRARE